MASIMKLRSQFLRALPDVAKRCRASCSSHTSEAPATNDSSAPNTDLIKCLIDQGIPSTASEEIASKLPNVRIDVATVHRTMNSWASLQFGRERLVDLLTAHPGLVLTSPDRISKCYTNLVSAFTQNYTYKILYNAPNVIEQKRSEISDKIDFLHKQLGIPNSQIVNSSALSHNLRHLKVRSEFLKRCGILKPSTKKDDVTTIIDLADMFDSTDVQFSTKVAKLSPIEYETFTTLYALEIEDDDSDFESDSDSD